jgi:hypothetical protein
VLLFADARNHDLVLSEHLWRHSLNADSKIVGSVVHINGDPFTVLGVMPETLSNIDTSDLWQALHVSPADPGYRGDNFQMIARLKPGLSVTHRIRRLRLGSAPRSHFPALRRRQKVPTEVCTGQQGRKNSSQRRARNLFPQIVFNDRPVYQEEHAAQLIMARRICSQHKG